MNFENLENRLDFVCQPANQPYVRPGCARCMAPEILYSEGNPIEYTKLLFQQQFTYCAMVILLSFLSLLSSLSMECINNFGVTTTFHTRCKQEQ